jgi:hypothetical protein
VRWVVKQEGRVSRGACPLIASGAWGGSPCVGKDSPNPPRCLPVVQQHGLLLLLLLLLCLLQRPLPVQQVGLLKARPVVLLPPGVTVLLMQLPVLLLLCCALVRWGVVVRLRAGAVQDGIALTLRGGQEAINGGPGSVVRVLLSSKAARRGGGGGGGGNTRPPEGPPRRPACDKAHWHMYRAITA